jgi:hypothetical protein
MKERAWISGHRLLEYPQSGPSSATQRQVGTDWIRILPAVTGCTGTTASGRVQLNFVARRAGRLSITSALEIYVANYQKDSLTS